MCGIVGIIGKKEAYVHVLEGLKKLEYRGYDSSGLAYILDKELNEETYKLHFDQSMKMVKTGLTTIK